MKKSRILLTGVISFCSLISISHAQELEEQDIDKMYKNTLKLGTQNLDSTYLMANEIFEQSQRSGYEFGIIQAEILASYYFWERYKLDTAKILLDDCLSYFSQNSDYQNTLTHGRVLFYYGRVAIRGQELRLGKKYALQALEIFEQIENKVYQGNTLNLLGGAELGLTNYSSSLDYFLEAYKKKLDANGSDEDCISEISNISIVYSRMGQYEKALELAQKSLKLAQDIGDPYRQINTLNSIGTYYNSLGNMDSSFYYYRKSRDFALSQGNTTMAFLAEYNIANMLSNNGEYARSNEIMMDLYQNEYQISPSIEEVAQTLIAKNYLKLTRYDSAIIVATPIFQSAQAKGSKQTIINVTDILRKAFSEIDKHDSAYHYLNILQAFRDSVYSIENQRKLSTVYAEFESIEKVSEIEALKLKQYQSRVRLTVIFVTSAAIIILLVVFFLIFKKQQKLKQQLLEVQLTKSKKKLSTNTLSMIHQNNVYEGIEEELKEINLQKNGESNPALQKILNSLKLNKSLEQDWDNFTTYFSELNADFSKYLNNSDVELSDYEFRLCALIKLKLTNKEIATILNIEYESVKMAKYRLKKKLNIRQNQTLSEYIRGVA